MESIVAALIGGGVVTLIGAIASNPRSRAAIELKIDKLTPCVEKHSCRIGYAHKLERACLWSGATLTRFCDELERELAIATCIPALLAAVLSRQTLAHSDCHTTNETY